MVIAILPFESKKDEMKLNVLIDRILKTTWTSDLIDKYIGVYRKSYFSFALDESVRRNAASGGSVTAILTFLLQSKKIDGALVCRSVVENGKVASEFFIATSPEELKLAQGSKYIATRFSAQAIPLLKNFTGKLAVVTLPCDAKILARYREQNPSLDERIVLVITLFCGHNSQPELTEQIVNKLRPENQRLISYRHRAGHWRGQLTAVFEGNQEVQKPFSYFSDYQNLYFFCERKCFHCYDHTGYYCDVSAGDIWLQRMKDDPIKHTALITRTEAGQKIVEEAFTARQLAIEERPIEEICEGQARSLKIHYNISARSRVDGIFKENIKDYVGERVLWHDYVIAFLILFNYKFSQTKIGQKIISYAPRPFIKFYLYFLKGWEIL